MTAASDSPLATRRSLDLQTEEIPRLAAELLVGAAQAAQARRARVRGSVAGPAPGDWSPVPASDELVRELRVAHALGRREIVALEESKGDGPALVLVLGAQILHGLVEERANELLMKELVGFGHRDETARRDLTLCAVEVERQRLDATAALQSRRRLPHVHDEAVGAHADKRAEAGLAWLVALEPRFLKRVGKEALREIARVFGVQAPGQAKVFVDGLPVALDEVAERIAPGIGIGVANAFDRRVPVAGKPPLERTSSGSITRLRRCVYRVVAACRFSCGRVKGMVQLAAYHIRRRAWRGLWPGRRSLYALRAWRRGLRMLSSPARSTVLYQLPLDEFTAARNALAKEAGAAGAEIRALQKPPLAAWAINQVIWRGRPTFHAFNASAAALRAAHSGVVSGKRADLRAAGKAHEEALEAVAKAALAILRDAGQPATDATKQAILTTLRALPASSDPPGRLTQVLQPTGFELLAGLSAAPADDTGNGRYRCIEDFECCGGSDDQECRADEGAGQSEGGRRRRRSRGAGRRRESAPRGIRDRSCNARS